MFTFNVNNIKEAKEVIAMLQAYIAINEPVTKEVVKPTPKATVTKEVVKPTPKATVTKATVATVVIKPAPKATVTKARRTKAKEVIKPTSKVIVDKEVVKTAPKVKGKDIQKLLSKLTSSEFVPSRNDRKNNMSAIKEITLRVGKASRLAEVDKTLYVDIYREFQKLESKGK